MADGIFTEEEIQAAGEVPTDAPEQQVDQQPEDGQSGPARDPETGKFVSKEKGDEGDEGKPPQGHVPQGALHAEREKRKGIEAELKRAQEQLAAIANLRQQVQSRAAPKVAEPPTDEDPNGVEHLKKRIAELEEGTTRITQAMDTQRLDEQENAHISAYLGQAEAAFRQHTPDYDDAIRHVINARAQELSLYGLSPVEVRTAIANEVADIARAAIAQGRDPAEVGYQLAQLRGYRASGGESAGGGTGKAAGKIDAIGRAKEQSRTIGNGAGSAPAGELTAEQIIAMSPQEFEALYDTPEGRKIIDAVCGGM